jgi:hypothetical protein
MHARSSYRNGGQTSAYLLRAAHAAHGREERVLQQALRAQLARLQPLAAPPVRPRLACLLLRLLLALCCLSRPLCRCSLHAALLRSLPGRDCSRTSGLGGGWRRRCSLHSCHLCSALLLLYVRHGSSVSSRGSACWGLLCRGLGFHSKLRGAGRRRCCRIAGRGGPCCRLHSGACRAQAAQLRAVVALLLRQVAQAVLQPARAPLRATPRHLPRRRAPPPPLRAPLLACRKRQTLLRPSSDAEHSLLCPPTMF